MVDALIEEAQLLAEQGTEARIAAAEVGAADLAEETRLELISIQGDANATAAKKEAVKHVFEVEESR